jgi:hypothetical protein
MWKSISDASWQYINLPLSLSPSLALVELKKYLMHEQEQGGGGRKHAVTDALARREWRAGSGTRQRAKSPVDDDSYLKR